MWIIRTIHNTTRHETRPSSNKQQTNDERREFDNTTRKIAYVFISHIASIVSSLVLLLLRAARSVARSVAGFYADACVRVWEARMEALESNESS